PHVEHLAVAGPSTVSGAAWSLANRWFADCTASHPGCGPEDPSFLPTRLLQISPDPSAPVRLVVMAEENLASPHLRYASLSHCWGGADVPTLTSRSIAGLKQPGIPASSLPRTFAEAVAMVRRLGLAYLWIDSLCIVQDSADDWASEAGIMGDVYSNSTLNIMATASRDSHGGLARERDPEAALRLVCVETAWLQIQGQTTRRTYHLAIQDMWRTAVAEAPLNTRGWVLQERVLSPRALHFGSQQLLWECRSLSACETFPAGLPELLLDDVDRIKPLDASANVLKNKEQQLVQARRDAWLSDTSSLWSNWVDAYSAAKLTRRSDKMVAISGLVKKMRAMRGGDRYLAGLWRTGLIDQLLWYAITPAPSLKASQPSTGIPSWSWAAVDTDVIPGLPTSHDGVRRHIKIIDVSTSPAFEGDDTSALRGGELRVKGNLVPGTMTANTIHLDGIGKLDAEVHPDEEGVHRLNVVLLPVMTDYRGANPEVSALLLQRADTKPPGYYRRVGCVTTVSNRQLIGGHDELIRGHDP
ncbi:heterokaryon incompatibility protein-domain-containing protein, partial [Microdochium trichocladiopsis]